MHELVCFALADVILTDWMYRCCPEELALAVRPASKSVIAAKCFLLGVVDKDGDGRLDHKELHGKHFDALDADGDGKLDPHEFLRDVNHVDPDGYGSTMLHYAAADGNLPVVRFLVSCGANL